MLMAEGSDTVLKFDLLFIPQAYFLVHKIVGLHLVYVPDHILVF